MILFEYEVGGNLVEWSNNIAANIPFKPTSKHKLEVLA